MTQAQDSSAFTQAATLLVAALARRHGFRLPDLSVAEGNRLLGFIEAMTQGDYPETKDWTPVMFSAARQTARADIERKLAAAQPK